MRYTNLINAASSWINPLTTEVDALTTYLTDLDFSDVERETLEADRMWILELLDEVSGIVFEYEGSNHEAIQELAGIIYACKGEDDVQAIAKAYVKAMKDAKNDSDEELWYFDEQMEIAVEAGDIEMAQHYLVLKKYARIDPSDLYRDNEPDDHDHPRSTS